MFVISKEQVRREQGQHTYINQNVPPPGAGTQIFCGNLPRSMYEIELFPYFALIGEIYEFRLMMEFSGFSRGFCFVTYMTVEAAEEAVRSLHGYVLRDRELFVYKSWDNSKLFVHGIPLWLPLGDVTIILKKMYSGLIKISCKRDEGSENSEHRGWAFLEFENHRKASICRKDIWPRKLMPWGAMMSVEWARPERDNNCCVILEDLPNTTTKTEVFEIVKPKLEPGSLVQIFKVVGQTSATLIFNTRSAANHAVASIKGIRYNGVQISVFRKASTGKVNMPNSSIASTSDDGVNATIQQDNANDCGNNSDMAFANLASTSSDFHDNPFAHAFADTDYYDFNPGHPVNPANNLDNLMEDQDANIGMPLESNDLNNVVDWCRYDLAYNQIYTDDPFYRPSTSPNFDLTQQYRMAYAEVLNFIS